MKFLEFLFVEDPNFALILNPLLVANRTVVLARYDSPTRVELGHVLCLRICFSLLQKTSKQAKQQNKTKMKLMRNNVLFPVAGGKFYLKRLVMIVIVKLVLRVLVSYLEGSFLRNALMPAFKLPIRWKDVS